MRGKAYERRPVGASIRNSRTTNMTPKTSKIINGLLATALTVAGSFVLSWEGEKLDAYQDSVGVWTICDGHTAGVKRGDKATPEVCKRYRDEDLASAYQAVDQCITVPLTTNQIAAFTSASFNLGPSVVCGSTLQKKANAGDIKGACDELSRWVHAGGVVLKGLQNRRAAEVALCWPDFHSTVAGARSTAAFLPKDH